MKKITLLLFGLIIFTSFNQFENDYILLFNDSSSIKFFKHKNYSYYEHFLSEKEDFNNKEYFVQLRNYSWGKIDTSYYRKGKNYYYHYDKSNKKESIVLPIEPKLNEIWYEADKSWKYEITAIDQKFKTPDKKIKNCVVVKAEQLFNRDKNKSKIYYLYYSKGLGYVGNGNPRGKAESYLIKMKLNAKVGDTIKLN